MENIKGTMEVSFMIVVNTKGSYLEIGFADNLLLTCDFEKFKLINFARPDVVFWANYAKEVEEKDVDFIVPGVGYFQVSYIYTVNQWLGITIREWTKEHNYQEKKHMIKVCLYNWAESTLDREED